MRKYHFLNSREIKKLKGILIKSFGYALQKDYAYLINEKERVFIVNKDLFRINLNNLIIDRIGLYFAEYKNIQIRLSKEGAQLLVKEAREQAINLLTRHKRQLNEVAKRLLEKETLEGEEEQWWKQ